MISQRKYKLKVNNHATNVKVTEHVQIRLMRLTKIRFLKTFRVSNEDLFIESHSANHVRRPRELLAACESETNKYLPNVDEKR